MLAQYKIEKHWSAEASRSTKQVKQATGGVEVSLHSSQRVRSAMKNHWYVQQLLFLCMANSSIS
eukprot:1282600-Amphidinium_carterae.2